MRRLLTIMLLCLFSPTAYADGEKAGDFDYYVLSLSWSPSWCEIEGDDRSSPQCDARNDYGFVLHGLWPQFERGWPSYCRTGERNPSRAMTGAMVDIMGDSGSAWHQWNKHGRCSGLSAADYFDLAREAYASVERPEVFRRIESTLRFPALIVEDAFIEANPALNARMLTVTCKRDHFQEVRICLDKALSPRVCGRDVSRDCSASVNFPNIR